MDASPPKLRVAVHDVTRAALRSYAERHCQDEECGLTVEAQPTRPPLRDVEQHWQQARSTPIASSPSVLSKTTRESSAGQTLISSLLRPDAPSGIAMASGGLGALRSSYYSGTTTPDRSLPSSRCSTPDSTYRGTTDLSLTASARRMREMMEGVTAGLAPPPQPTPRPRPPFEEADGASKKEVCDMLDEIIGASDDESPLKFSTSLPRAHIDTPGRSRVNTSAGELDYDAETDELLGNARVKLDCVRLGFGSQGRGFEVDRPTSETTAVGTLAVMHARTNTQRSACARTQTRTHTRMHVCARARTRALTHRWACGCYT
jgi:hypothetical protein